MADNVITLPPRGKTYLTGPNRTASATAGTSKALEGIKKNFADVDYSSTDSIKPRRSGGEVTCLFVRNASGVALLPGRVVSWKLGAIGKQVDGNGDLQYEAVAGIVDELLPAAGVAANDYFWLVVKGNAICKNSLAASTITQGEYVLAQTAAASTANTTNGRIISYTITSNATFAVSAALNRIGIAQSTTATTGADVLVYVDLD